MATKSNTRTRTGRNTLAAILAKMTAAAGAYAVACTREDRASMALRRLMPVDHAKAVGGMSPQTTLIIGNKPPQILPASEFYYRSHEDIDKAMKEKAAKANNGAERRAIAADRKRLHAELKRDADRIAALTVRSVPRAVVTEARRADIALNKASTVYDKAKNALLAFRPKSAADAATLLEYCAAKTATDIIHDTEDAAAIMRNAAKAIRTSARR
jgi:hypothetical protein